MEFKRWSWLITICILARGQEVLSLSNCSPVGKPEIECIASVHRNVECSPSALQEAYPHIYTITDNHSASKPFFFDGSLFTELYKGNGKTYAGVDLDFHTPVDGGIDYLKGFELMIYSFGTESTGVPTSTSCIIFDLSNVTWAMKDYGIPFKRKIFPLAGQRLYELHLYSLPKSPVDHDQFSDVIFTTPSSVTRTSFSKDWVTGIRYKVINDKINAKVKFHFIPPPERFNFTEFEVKLVRLNDYWTAMETFITVFSHQFNNVRPGVYEIWIEPFDKHRNDPSKCLCTGEKGMCRTCVVTKTPPFNVTATKYYPTASTTSKSPHVALNKGTTSWDKGLPVEPFAVAGSTAHENTRDDGTLKIVMACVGSVLGLALVSALIAVVYCQLKRRRQDPADINGWQKEIKPRIIISPGKTKALTRKRVHLVYFQDHSYHVKVIETLADYLQTHCFCDVLYAPWCLTKIMEEGKMIWSLKSIQNADFTIIIHSEGSYRHYMAWKENMTYEGCEIGPIGDMFIPVVNYILNQYMCQQSYKKYIMAYFDYSRSEHIPSEMSTCLQYKLLKHFKELLCYIHGLTSRIDYLDDIDLPMTDDHSSTTEGRKLMVACSEASNFQKKNPNWFKEMYGVCSQEERKSDRHDSGVDTSMPNLADDEKMLAYGNTVQKDDVSWFPPSEIGTLGDEMTPADTKSRTASEYMELINRKYEQEIYKLGMQCVPISDCDSDSLGGQSV